MFVWVIYSFFYLRESDDESRFVYLFIILMWLLYYKSFRFFLIYGKFVEDNFLIFKF